MQKNLIQSLRIIEILIKSKKRSTLTKKLNMLPLHERLSKIHLNNTQMGFDATFHYPSAMWDEKSVYFKIETGFAFKTTYE